MSILVIPKEKFWFTKSEFDASLSSIIWSQTAFISHLLRTAFYGVPNADGPLWNFFGAVNQYDKG